MTKSRKRMSKRSGKRMSKRSGKRMSKKSGQRVSKRSGKRSGKRIGKKRYTHKGGMKSVRSACHWLGFGRTLPELLDAKCDELSKKTSSLRPGRCSGESLDDRIERLFATNEYDKTDLEHIFNHTRNEFRECMTTYTNKLDTSKYFHTIKNIQALLKGDDIEHGRADRLSVAYNVLNTYPINSIRTAIAAGKEHHMDNFGKIVSNIKPDLRSIDDADTNIGNPESNDAFSSDEILSDSGDRFSFDENEGYADRNSPYNSDADEEEKEEAS